MCNCAFVLVDFGYKTSDDCANESVYFFNLCYSHSDPNFNWAVPISHRKQTFQILGGFL